MNLQRWYGQLLSHWDTIRSSYWFIPALMTLSAWVTAAVLLSVDRYALLHDPEWFAWVPRVSSDTSRALLSTIAGSMITVTGVVFSITIVALTLASSQFGPRLLRTFFRDRGNQVALGTFLATFFYSVLVLRAVDRDGGMPHIATGAASIFGLASLFVLIYFINHAAQSIQASSLIASVAGEIEDEIDDVFPETVGDPPREPELSEQDRRRIQALEHAKLDVPASCSGYVRVVNGEELVALAVKHDLLVHLDRRPGQFVARGTRLATLSAASEVDEEIGRAIGACFVLGDQRTPVQDIYFLIQQLTEMAVRALSPGVNDPGTASSCVRRLGQVIAMVSNRQFPSGRRFDEAGRLRVLSSPTSFAEIASACFDPIRRYGSAHTDVVLTAMEAMHRAADAGMPPERRAVLLEHAKAIHAVFTGTAPAPRDEALVSETFATLEASLRA